MEVQKIACVICSLICTCACVDSSNPVAPGGMRAAPVTEWREVLKGTMDTCKYLLQVLPNGIKVVFVEDPGADKEVLLVSIKVGAEHDVVPGTAHFLEHLLFMGTKKYPGKSDYEDFASKCGASTNAFTSMSDTVYYLEMPSGLSEDTFKEAVDRIAQFFVNPLFLVECVNDEMNAVNSEFVGNMKMDSRRQHQVCMSHANPEHPINRFPSGNNKSLSESGIDMREEVIEFYNKHYLPQDMVVVIYTPRSVDSIKEVVAAKFSEVGNGEVKKRTARNDDPAPYLPDAFSQVLWIESIQKRTEISIEYILPGECMDVYRKPQMYLVQLLSYRGEGSLYRQLWAQGLITSIDPSFCYDYSYGYGEFTITIKLTEDGLQNYEKVVAAVLAYIEMLQSEQVNERVMQEIQSVQKMSFETYTYRRPDLVSELVTIAENLRNLGFKRMISNRYLVEEVNAGVVGGFIRMLGSNFFVTVLDPGFDGRFAEQDVQREEWYGTRYAKIKYDKNGQMVQEMKSALGSIVYPPVNEFIVDDLEIKCRDVGVSELPVILANGEWSRMWHRVDGHFKVPEARLGFVFKGKYRLASVQNDVMTEILCRMVEYVVKEEMHTALNSGYEVSLKRATSAENGVLISISGYNEKIARVVAEVMRVVADASFKQSVLETVKRECKECLEQWEKKLPREKIHKYTGYCLKTGVYAPFEEVGCVDAITVEDMQRCAQDLFGTAKLETLVYGNILAEEAVEIHEQVVGTLVARYPRRDALECAMERVQATEQDRPLFYRATPGNESCVCLYIDTGVLNSRRDTFLRMLFNQVTEGSFFTELRANQQLGYAVFQAMTRDNFADMLVYLVQSERPVCFVYERITEFIDGKAHETIAGISNDELGEYKQAVQNVLMMRKGQKDEFEYTMSKILNGTYDFEARELGADMVQGFTKDDLVRFVDERVTKRSATCFAMVAEDRYEDELVGLNNNNLGLTLVHIDTQSVAKWRCCQKQHLEPAHPVMDVGGSK